MHRNLAWSAMVVGAVVAVATPAVAQPVKPRFLMIVDTSGSMSLTPAGVETRGDGSARHPGCDVEGSVDFADSRLYQAKAALNDTIAAFGSAEFALARYKSVDLATTCTTDANCNAASGNSYWTCVDPPHIPGTQRYCAVASRQGCNNNNFCYAECNSATAPLGCCATRRSGEGSPDPWDIYTKGLECPGTGDANNKSDCAYPGCIGADVVVPFPTASSNYGQLLSWLDGAEDFPLGTNKELRANGSTPIAGSLNGALDWLTNAASAAGAGAGIKISDARGSCRQYSVILLTDGAENCDVRTGDRAAGAVAAATALSAAGVKTYVIAFAINDAQSITDLGKVATAGGTGQALLASNRAELTARLGDIIASSIPTPKCDCDETCDGPETQSFPQKGQTCSVGQGRCKRNGQYACNGAQNGVICSSTPSGTCPGTALTAGTPLTEACGQAAACDPTLTAEECADDDCDGQVDEGLSCQCAAVPESCNGLDDNCNGITDDVTSVACGLAIGECRQGATACLAGRTVCQNATGPATEICDNKDNDCDGVIDGFGQTCYPSVSTGCSFASGVWTCAGACQAGNQICRIGAFGACSGAITPTTEIACDGIDNDCDGATDEGFNLGQTCGLGASGVGECRPGQYTCVNGGIVCQGGRGPSEELCDGLDNDCDGNTDAPLGPCGSALGECKPGTYTCQSGLMVCVQPQGPGAEVCDGKDNDCNGAIDDNLMDPTLGVACSSNVGVCRSGVLRCISGRKVCDGGVLPQTEVCNAADDDCDGCVDCDPGCLAMLGKSCPIPGSGQACGLAVGECRPGQLLCVVGSIQCVGATPPGVELCDSKDNDCNGFTDETDPQAGAPCYPAGTPGCDAATNVCVGQCQFGGQLCRNGGFACGNPVTPSAEICDVKDNDCDGMTDEDFDVGAPCDNGGTDTCRKTGTRICNGRGDGTTCSVPPLQVSAEVCDGDDNDCDGQIDELPLAGVGVSCGLGVGECRTGVTRCEMGKILCNELGPTPEICDGKDNDCDGQIDEGLTPPGDECLPPGLPGGSALVGECKPGKFFCAKGADGAWGWVCRGGAGPTAEICDGKDNDCDGMGDDEPPCPVGSACMAGECTPRCSAGEFPCAADRICKQGFCIRNPCINKACPGGSYCDENGDCIDRCATAACLPGQSCESGVCFDCFTRGCPDGQLCRNRICEPDACAAVTCAANSFCKDGACIRSCSGVSCGAGESCRDGQCAKDPCASKACGSNEFCGADGQCKPRPCVLVACVAGQKCVETTGRCEADPCIGVRCAPGDQCAVTPDGRPDCQADVNAPPRRTVEIGASGGGLSSCNCRVGDRGESGPGGAWAAVGLLLAAFGRARRRRNRRRQGGAR